MIDRLIDFCARKRWLILGLTLLLCLWAWDSLRRIPLDAIPDLSDTQVIVYSTWDRSPDLVEDQVTYPVIRALQGAPKVKSIRGFSDFGFSYVYVIFEDGTDLYWARSRVLEAMAKIQGQLPQGVQTQLGPDATSVGWVYQYALVDKSGQQDLAQLRSLQDWNLRSQLQSLPGVAEVASLGGFVKQVQVQVDPLKMQARGISVLQVADAVRNSNNEMGARLLEFSGAEFMVRGRGYAKTLADFEEAPVKWDPKTGTALRVKDLAKVAWGPELRRGVSDLDGEGEAVGGIVVMRQGENAPKVIAAVKQRLEELKSSLPAGVEIVPVYDRSELIHRAVHTVSHELVLEMLVVSLVILLFLWHLPSALIPILTLPIAVLLAFIPMQAMGVSANIMSLAGIAVAIGAMVDASIVVVENSHKRLEEWQSSGQQGDYREVLIAAIKEVARPSFFSLLVIAVAFLPVFSLVGREGRLFRPLAFTKNLSMLVAAVLAITLDPALRLALIRLKSFEFKPRWLAKLANSVVVGTMHPEEENPVSRFLFKLYHPVVDWVLEHPRKTLAAALLALLITLPLYFRLGSEFMPSLDEGSLLYMPTSMPGLSETEAARMIQRQDQVLRSFPEVERVWGKAGRAETPTDVAPFSMVETTVTLKPREAWPEKKRWYSSWMPEIFKPFVRWIWDDRQTTQELVDSMNSKMQFAGFPNIWTQPIINRIDMLDTGIRTPVGIKILGPDLAQIEDLGKQVEGLLKGLPSTRSAVAERTAGGYFLDVEWDRAALGRHGISVAEAQETLASAVGGENVSQVVLGRERYPVNVRYPRAWRENEEQLRHVLLRAPNGAPVALGSVAKLQRLEGPGMIRNENGQVAGYVSVDVAGQDLGSYVAQAKALLGEKLRLPTGYSLVWSGQIEGMQRVKEQLKVLLPLTLALIWVLIYLNTRSGFKTALVLLAVPFSLLGAVWLLWILDYNLSVAVAVGMIALAGLDAETGIFMLLYLDLAHDEAKARGLLKSVEDLKGAIVHGAVKRVRPKVMTVATAFCGLLPIMFAHGEGADVMKRIAAPMVGGLFSSFALELIVYPAVYYLWKKPTWGPSA
jgi:Cu(I)/Ag(I) efflux system membrane protein CusA/SilA